MKNNEMTRLFLAFSFLCIFSHLAFSESRESGMSFGENFVSEQGHRFIEIKGALPVYPALTTHGFAQSMVVALTDTFGEVLTNGNYENTTPKLATDLSITFFPPITENYRIGFMAGAALDRWDSTVVYDSKKSEETLTMDYYYAGVHIDYGHWVMSSIGTRISIYGEYTIGMLHYDDGIETENMFCFDICPFGVQFCPEKHIGIYFEIPHLGARPFFQTGISIGL